MAKNDGTQLERLVGDMLGSLRAKYDDRVQLIPQYKVPMQSGRSVRIDFRLCVAFAHEHQNYYFELQSRKKHGHELADKIEAVRRDTQLKAFSFVHDMPIERSIRTEMRSRGIVLYGLKGLQRFIDGVDLQLAALAHLQAEIHGDSPRVDPEYKKLARKVEESEVEIRHMRAPPNQSINALLRNSDAVADLLKRFLG